MKYFYRKEKTYHRKFSESVHKMSLISRNTNVIVCEITKRNLDLIMDVVLRECNLLVSGYNINTQEYWGKPKGKNMFILKVEDYKLTIQTKNEYDFMDVNQICGQISELLELFEDIPNL